MQTKLNLISEIAKRDGESKINNLAYLLNEENLKDCFSLLSKGKAAGIDGVTLEEYGANLDSNLENLVQRMKNQAYKPQPVRRTYIPKADGKLRPLGIPSLEDKIVQKGMARILESIYENEFLDSFYGFRPSKNCHQALKKLNDIIYKQPVNHIIDADIKGFFDNVDHDWLMKFLEVRISDPNFLRLIKRFLKNGYMEEGIKHATDTGTPQGGIVSPILANIYLHYVLDLWIDRALKPNCRGTVEIVRYADDFVICVQYKDEANKILIALKERLKKFNLELAEDKTRLIEFGKFAKTNANAKAKSRAGAFKIGRKTDKKKSKLKMIGMNTWLKDVRNLIPIKELWKTFRAKLRGHFQYYGVSENYRSIKMFYQESLKLMYKWLNRRSQKKSFNWKTFLVYIGRFELPQPSIHHDFYSFKSSFREY